MDISLQESGERLVHQPVPLYQRFSGKDFGHDQELEVPLAAATDMIGVGRAVITNFETHRTERILHHRTDSFNPGSDCPRLTHGPMLRAMRTGCRWSQTAWPMARAASAIVKPKPLKYTQARSVAA